MIFWLAQINLNAPRISGGFPGLVSRVIALILQVGGAVSLIMVLVGAFLYVTSGGNPDATKKAKDTIMYALIGLVISASAYAIVDFVLDLI